MVLFLTIEAQNATKNGLSEILSETRDKLRFLTDEKEDLENKNNYGTEFREIAIIPCCVDDEFWDALGWKERKQIWRQKHEADIRLRMDYVRFNGETAENKRLMFYDVIIKSIQEVQNRSKGDFEGKKMIEDILQALNVTKEDLIKLDES